MPVIPNQVNALKSVLLQSEATTVDIAPHPPHLNRLKDLMIPFRERWYFTPEMQGSYSIKKVLPALVPDLSYKYLTIQEGGMASNSFTTMLHGNFTGDVAQTRQDLLDYCALDTLAMVRILERLREV